MLCNSSNSLQEFQKLGISAHMWTFREHIDVETWNRQHANLCQTIQEHAHSDTKVVLLNDLLALEDAASVSTEVAQSPNMSFMRDPLCSLPWQPATFFHCSHAPICRKFEPGLAALGAERLGFRPLFPNVDDGPYKLYTFDGGDLIPFVYGNGVRCLLVGIGFNTNLTSTMKLAEELLPTGFCDEVIGVQMIAGRMNLDECFVPVTDNVVAAHVPSLMWGERFRRDQPQPERFDFAQWIRDLGYTFTFDRERAPSFESTLDYLSCNFLCLGRDRKVVGYGLDKTMLKELARLEVNVISVEASELLKGDGGVRCLTRPLYM